MSSQTVNYFPYFNPPPPASHLPPPPPPHSVSQPPPPHPHPVTPPPPHVLPPPQPHTFAPPPPYIQPPPSPLPPAPDHHHPTVIIIVFISCGGLFFFAFMAAALFCCMKKHKKKTVQEAVTIQFDEHRKVKEEIVEGPHGTEAIILSIEDDVQIEEKMKKNEKVGESCVLGAKETESASSVVEDGGVTSAPAQVHHLEHKSTVN